MLQGNDREVQHVKHIACSVVWKKDMIPSVKLDILEKNVGKQNVIKNLPHIGVKKDEMYVNKQCWHV